MIDVVCPRCGLEILVPPSVQGKSGVCFNCGGPVTIPSVTMMKRHLNLEFAKGDRVADRYNIEEQIGRGGMGVVYRAHDTLVDEVVALKFLAPKLLTEKGKQLFLREAQVARRLRHENIVAVHDVNFTSEGILYLSMEFAKGQSLRDYLRTHREQRRLVKVRLAVEVVKQMLAALEYAHRSVIHRDIKPENVMMMPGEAVKVLDFGLARAVHQDLSEHQAELQAAGKGKVIGTLAYAAPEQLRMREVDARADLYAVGLVLHELLTLRTPVDVPVTVEQVRKDVSPGLLAVLKRALKEEREQRWASAREFRLALRDAYNESYRPSAVNTRALGQRGEASTEGMAYLEGGSFLMGNDANRSEAPEEEVTVGPFWMDRYPVTVAQYSEYLKATGHAEPKYWRDPQYNGADQPVVGVTWEQAQAFAHWCGKELPTEAQWEFAARGRENRRYPWGSLPPSSTRANFGDFIGMPSMVTMHDEGQTPDGIFDLAGNVMEWTLDPYSSYVLIRMGKREEALMKEPRRAVRGGSWASAEDELVTTARNGLFPESQLNTVGFRCVIPVSE
jgi:formylglycine-generating enzyme required for sulfatase activity/tRNA A-37 threonylcarbamoyl transferase component Bud32